MRYLSLSADPDKQVFPVCFLVPTIKRDEIVAAYIKPYSLDPEDVLAIDLHYVAGKKKTPVAEMKRFLAEELMPNIEDLGIDYLVVADAEYFKLLTGSPKADANLGYVMDSAFGPQKVIYVPNFRTILYDPPKVKAKVAQGIEALIAHRAGVYAPPGDSIIQFAAYPTTVDEIREWLQKLLVMGCDLTCDIEAFSLKHTTAGIGTITFCWSKTAGIAFPVDYVPIDGATEAPFGVRIQNDVVRQLLLEFFLAFKRKMIWHNISYDVYVLIYQLFMKGGLLDNEGMLHGIDTMLANWDDTKLIAYLATNSCAGNKLGLKEQAQEYAGNYAVEEIKDITKTPLDSLLQYNLADGLSTWFVWEKRFPQMVVDDQLEIYETIFKPAILDIVQMQLTGMPVDMPRVKEVRTILETDLNAALLGLEQSPVVQQYTYRKNEAWVEMKNTTLKKKRVTMADAKEVFNPGSAQQLQDLLYGMLGLPVIATTKSKQPSTKAKVLKDLKNHTTDANVLAFLDTLADYSAVAIILETFIPAMEQASECDGWHYLFGNFNLGGTVSGRLSSSNPNLQNIPANSKYAKLIKTCFKAPPGWLFVGLDFASLEDRISALTTKDPNKLKVYTDGYDGHCMRAYAYFGDQMPDIVDMVQSINTIETLYKHLRQDSKAPTFALTYQGTYITLMKNCGFSKEKAQLVEARFKELYKVSVDWVAEKLQVASQVGYVTAAFGLRVRTPLLHQTIRKTRSTPYEAEAEGRTAGNALGQSWCLLNSRACSEFMGKVRQSPYKHEIRPCAQIHDAQYYLIRDNISALAYTNKHLVQAVEWQAHPDIEHDQVKLGGEVGIFYPNWSKEITIPNGVSEEEIFQIIDTALAA